MRIKQLGTNQTIVYVTGQEYFFSYDTCVAGRDDEGKYWKVNKKYSNTTSKHVKAYLDSNEPVLVAESDTTLALDCV